jgi:DNA-binding PadR family transcriptional regulator
MQMYHSSIGEHMKHFQEHYQNLSHSEGQPDHESRRFRFGGREGHCGKHFRGRGSEFGGGHGGGEGRHGFGRPWGRGGFGGRMPFAARVFGGDDLKIVLLKLIDEKPSHGYELMKDIEEKLNGAYSPSPGLIYPTLTWLEEMGYATVSTSEGSKKLYTITDDGRKFLAEKKSVVDAIFERMNEAGNAYGHGRAPQILRAVENFRYALRLKTTQGQITPEQIQKIADAIDAAAKLVEQA